MHTGGKSPCRLTGKANIQIVVRLCRAPASNQPPFKKRSALQNDHHRSSAEQAGAGQSDSDAPQAPQAVDCRPSQSKPSAKQYHILARLKAEELLRRAENEEIRKRQNHSKKLNPNTQPSPDIRALLLQLPGCHAFCKKNCKKHARQPSASARRRSEENRSSRNSGKSTCRCTGKANIQVVARRLREKVGPPLYRSGTGLHAAICNLASGFVMLLAGENSKRPTSPNE